MVSSSLLFHGIGVLIALGNVVYRLGGGFQFVGICGSARTLPKNLNPLQTHCALRRSSFSETRSILTGGTPKHSLPRLGARSLVSYLRSVYLGVVLVYGQVYIFDLELVSYFRLVYLGIVLVYG